MSRQARIEEISDSDPEEFDISTLLPDAPDLPIASSIFTPGRHIVPPPASSSTPRFSRNNAPPPPPAAPRGPVEPADPNQQQYLPSTDTTFKNYQCLYPVYFDSARSRAQGRKVPSSIATPNPLAREIADACGSLGLRAVFEPGKTHPKDWANPGRVRVLLKKEGVPVHSVLKNKYLLFAAIGEYLKHHPTQPDTPLKLRIPNVPFDGKAPKPPVVPRGWQLGSILPLHSPALSGPGVTDDIFKEMMGGMGMGGAPSPSPHAGPAIEAKKEKKKKAKK